LLPPKATGRRKPQMRQRRELEQKKQKKKKNGQREGNRPMNSEGHAGRKTEDARELLGTLVEQKGERQRVCDRGTKKGQPSLQRIARALGSGEGGEMVKGGGHFISNNEGKDEKKRKKAKVRKVGLPMKQRGGNGAHYIGGRPKGIRNKGGTDIKSKRKKTEELPMVSSWSRIWA